ncbi:hypothetical protein [Streptomyces sp. NPDC017993]
MRIALDRSMTTPSGPRSAVTSPGSPVRVRRRRDIDPGAKANGS